MYCEPDASGIPVNYPGVETDAFIVMPNHIHGIIILVGAGPCACPDSTVDGGQPRGVAPTHLSLPDIVHRFKTMTTKQYVDGVKMCCWPSFHRRLWQRNYYEHIICNEASIERIRIYIQDNPRHWMFDRENLLALAVERSESWRV